MNISENKFSIAPTAAMVLLMAREAYQEGLSLQFFNNLDIQDADKLEIIAKEMYPLAGFLSTFRKQYIRQLLAQLVKQDETWQVCILGAGLDPLAMHLTEHYNGAVSSIFEIDKAFMEDKKPMYRRLLDENHKIKLLTWDVTDIDNLLPELARIGYDEQKPAIILMEGLVHYISRYKLTHMLERLRSAGGQNILIMDYSLPFEDIPEPDRTYCKKLVQGVEDITNWPLQLYHRGDISNLVADNGGTEISVASMKDIEYELNNSNVVFCLDGAGLCELLHCRL